MISTRFCPVCGAANDDTQTHCFACKRPLPANAQDESALHGTLLHGRYRLGTSIGSGGYSAVYRGWDMQAGGRTVAIKQITLNGLDTEETIEATNTYNREVEALSVLSHPQVPRLYDHFNDPDHWYLVLEYIEGQTLEGYLEAREARNKPFQIEEVLGIGLQLCVVLTYLHSRHPPVVFRDLKPDNIMRTSSGKLYLIDFGIARHYTPGQSRDTQSLGSPGYAAPEQYGRAQTDTRTDLYGLGALLHQLLSGQDPSDTPRKLPPLRLNGQAGNAELERLIDYLLADNPQDRPASADDVSRELERIHHQQISTLDSRRIWQPPVPQNYPTSSGSQTHIYQQFGQPPGYTQSTLPKRRQLTRRRVIAALGVSAALIGGGAYVYSRVNAISSPALSGTAQASYIYTGHSDTINALAWSPDSLRVASASADRTMQVWNAQNGDNRYKYNNGSSAVNAAAWSSDGSKLIFGGNNGEVNLLVATDLQLDPAIIDDTSGRPINALAWAPSTSLAYYATGSDNGAIIIRDIGGIGATQIGVQAGAINSIAYSLDGWHLAAGSQDHTVMIWDITTYKRPYPTYRRHLDAVNSVIWLPNGVYLASASDDKTVQIWDVTSSVPLLIYQEHTEAVNAISSSPNGEYIASASADGTVRIWSTYNGSTLMTYTGHNASVISVAWSPDGYYIASGSTDKTVQIWQAPSLTQV